MEQNRDVSELVVVERVTNNPALRIGSTYIIESVHPLISAISVDGPRTDASLNDRDMCVLCTSQHCLESKK